MNRLSLNDMVLVSLFTALTSIGAWIAIPLPFSPVPIVLANLFPLMAGAILGKWLGSLSQVVYLSMGMVGIPVFAHFTAGPGVIAGPTGGYLLGYVAAAFIAGAIVEYLPLRKQSVLFPVSLTAGAAAVYVLGIPWLANVTGMSIPAALTAGMYPFLPGDSLKIIIGVVLCLGLAAQVPQVWRISWLREPAGGAEAER